MVLGVSVHFTLAWMRKVVGSNPGEGINRLSFVVSKNQMEGSKGRIECNLRSAIFEEQEEV